MRGPTLALIIGVVVIATVIALQQISQAQTKTTTPTPTTTPTTQTGAAPSAGIQYDPQKGKQYFSEIGCTACHAIKSLGISGGAVGPPRRRGLGQVKATDGKEHSEYGLYAFCPKTPLRDGARKKRGVFDGLYYWLFLNRSG
jgi:hypothetical protein